VDRSRVERVRLGWNEQQHPSRARVKGVRHRRWEPEASRREFSLRCHWCSWFSLTSAPVEHYVINRPIQFTDFHCVFFFAFQVPWNGLRGEYAGRSCGAKPTVVHPHCLSGSGSAAVRTVVVLHNQRHHEPS
jgi:hypothetical protein